MLFNQNYSVKSSKSTRTTLFLFTMVVLALFAIVTFLPYIVSLVVSFYDYYAGIPFLGVESSGFQNYINFLTDNNFFLMLKNTLSLSSLCILFGAGYTFACTYGICGVKRRTPRFLLLGLCLLPALLPLELFTYAFFQLANLSLPFSPKRLFQFPKFFTALHEVLVWGSLSVLIGTLLPSGYSRRKKTFFAVLVFISIRLVLFASCNLPFLSVVENDFNKVSAEVFSSHAFLITRLDGNYGYGNAIQIVSSMVSIIPAVFGFVLLLKLYQTYRRPISAPAGSGHIHPISKLPALLPLLVLALCVGVILLVPFSTYKPESLDSMFSPKQLHAASLITGILYPAVFSAIFLLLACLIAYCLSIGKTSILIMCTVLLFLASNVPGKFLLFRMVHLTDTPISIFLSQLPLCLLFALVLFFSHGRIALAKNPMQFFRESLPCMLLLLPICYTRIFEDYLSFSIYYSNIRPYPLSAYLRSSQLYGHTSVTFLLLCMIPCFVGLICFIFAGMLQKKNVMQKQK